MNRPDRQPQPSRATGIDPMIDNPYGWRRWDTPRIMVTCPHCQVRSHRTASSWAWRTDGGLDAMIRCDEGGVFSVWVAGAKPDDRQPQPLDLDAIEARANAASGGPWKHRSEVMSEGVSRYVTDAAGATVALVGHGPSDSAAAVDAIFIAAARTDVPALVAEVKRLRGEVADALAEGWDQGFLHNGRLLDNPHRAPHPDPLDENDHRDRVDRNGRTWRMSLAWQWVTECPSPRDCLCGGWHHRAANLAVVNEQFGPLTFADDPQTPPQATSGTETALRHAALAEVAEQAHRLSEAICDLLDGDPGFYTAPDTCQRILDPREHR